jgi:hypothetical protein
VSVIPFGVSISYMQEVRSNDRSDSADSGHRRFVFVKNIPPPACGILISESARWKTSPLKNESPPYPPAEVPETVPPKKVLVAVAGVLGIVDAVEIIVSIALFGSPFGTVACAAGPRAAESGVAGRGEVRGDGPCRGRSGAVVDVADTGRDIDAGGMAVESGCITGPVEKDGEMPFTPAA